MILSLFHSATKLGYDCLSVSLVLNLSIKNVFDLYYIGYFP